MSKADIHVEIKHAGQTHEIWLAKNDHKSAYTQKIKNAIVFVRQAKDRPIPAQIEEKKYHSERVIDTTTIIAF
jgi:hypothetical protein